MMKKKKNDTITFVSYLLKDGERFIGWYKNVGEQCLVDLLIVGVLILWLGVGSSLLVCVTYMPYAIGFEGYDINNLWVFVLFMSWVFVTYLCLRYMSYLDDVEKQQIQLDKHNKEYQIDEEINYNQDYMEGYLSTDESV